MIESTDSGPVKLRPSGETCHGGTGANLSGMGAARTVPFCIIL